MTGNFNTRSPYTILLDQTDNDKEKRVKKVSRGERNEKGLIQQIFSRKNENMQSPEATITIREEGIKFLPQLSMMEKQRKKFIKQEIKNFRKTQQLKKTNEKYCNVSEQETDQTFSPPPRIGTSQIKTPRKLIDWNLTYRQSLVNSSFCTKRPVTLYSKVQQQKHFIFKSKDQFIKRILISMGWKQNKDPLNDSYCLKWTTTDSPTDYIHIGQNQYFNHIKNSDQLTNKGKLTSNLKKNSNFYPRTYDLNTQYHNFSLDFYQTASLNLLKKYIQHFKLKSYSIYQNPKQITLEQLLKSKNFRAKKYNPLFTVNIELLFTLCKYLENLLRKNLQITITPSDEEEHQSPKNRYIHNFEDATQKMLLAYSRIPIQEDNQIKKFAFIQDNFLENHILQSRYETPSNDLISLLINYYKIFKKTLNSFYMDGINNIWILKPNATSKGQGIELINRLEKSQLRMPSKIAQKYIENCLIFKGVKKQNRLWKQVEGKKFDIRQWVLVIGKPMRIYKFSSAYLRFCSAPYTLQILKQQRAHLTNYYINKGNFDASDEESILNIEQLFSYLMVCRDVDIERSYSTQLDNIIVEALQSCLHKLELKQNCFQLFGFDLLLDESYKLWLIQINLSPACEQRTLWLKQMLEDMGTELLKLVLPTEYLTNLKINKQKKNEWKLIYENGQKKNSVRRKIQLKDQHLSFLNTIKEERICISRRSKKKPLEKKQQQKNHNQNKSEISKTSYYLLKILELVIKRRKKQIFKTIKLFIDNDIINQQGDHQEDLSASHLMINSSSITYQSEQYVN